MAACSCGLIACPRPQGSPAATGCSCLAVAAATSSCCSSRGPARVGRPAAVPAASPSSASTARSRLDRCGRAGEARAASAGPAGDGCCSGPLSSRWCRYCGRGTGAAAGSPAGCSEAQLSCLEALQQRSAMPPLSTLPARPTCVQAASRARSRAGSSASRAARSALLRRHSEQLEVARTAGVGSRLAHAMGLCAGRLQQLRCGLSAADAQQAPGTCVPLPAHAPVCRRTPAFGQSPLKASSSAAWPSRPGEVTVATWRQPRRTATSGVPLRAPRVRR